MKRFLFIAIFFATASLIGLANEDAPRRANPIQKVSPPYWWTGMENQDLQIIIYGNNIADYRLKLKHRGVEVKEIRKTDNPNYIIADLRIGENAASGQMKMYFSRKGNSFQYNYELKPKPKKAVKPLSLDGSDLVYLIMPDRFANGNYNNDSYDHMLEVGIHREEMYGRHGGDIQGVTSRLDYLQELGVTAVWLNPILENDQPEASYHGYAATDHYNIDRRYGGNEAYFRFIEECHKRGMKVVKDVIHNHVGHKHYMHLDPPFEDFINLWEEPTYTNYRIESLVDPYASEYDRKKMHSGWFVETMPDLNQKNKDVATYLIQNNIWWVMNGVDLFRLDTYPYGDLDFLMIWDKAMKEQFPNFNAFGESWVLDSPIQSYFHGNKRLKDDFNSGQSSVLDFNLHFAMKKALTEDFGWSEGLSRVYYALTRDYLYTDVSKNINFLDNHDMDRILSVVGEDTDKLKMGLGLLMTTRGIPCIYYGTEILMKNFSRPDGLVRSDFPGGWKEDSLDKFTAEGRTEAENDIFNYIAKLAHWRNKNETVQNGNLMQWIPEDGLYVFFRYDDNNDIMIIMNGEEEAKKLDEKRFVERTAGYTRYKNVISDREAELNWPLSIPAKSIRILELQK